MDGPEPGTRSRLLSKANVRTVKAHLTVFLPLAVVTVLLLLLLLLLLLRVSLALDGADGVVKGVPEAAQHFSPPYGTLIGSSTSHSALLDMVALIMVL